ncbi:MAG: tRNA 4-thiouridine(8) synthase ThiI [Clostridiales bacterium]|nr:tRNA 4-thiouridine(8) synthase ThiI [Clostridiales bacterium]
MEKTILIRIGEIFLKGNNKSFFLALLKKNIIESLDGLDFKLITTNNRMYLEKYNDSDEAEILSRLQCVFGIHSISPAVKIATDIEQIAKVCCELFPKEGVFRVTVNRADKRIDKTSSQIAAFIGGVMLKNSNKLKVNLFNYDFDVEVDIREKGYSYIFYKRIPCAGGLPVGCSGNGMLLLSGGIDSPVAGYLMAKRGVKIYAVHYHSFPYTSEQAKEKVLSLARTISRYTGEIELYVVPFTDIQYAIKEHCPIQYMITLMRRFMMKIAEKLAKNTGCGAIITGESLGQVASQTMESINVTNSVVNMPVFRPLVGFDKQQIVEISKNIDTYETSILPYEDCCTVFLPKNPVIKPKISYALDFESRLDCDKLIADALEKTEIVRCHFK